MKIIDETYEPRPWRCDECRRVLGVVMRDTRHIRLLWVFAKCLEEINIHAMINDLRDPLCALFIVHGVTQCHGVRCGKCGSLNKWSMSQEAYLQLISHYQKAPG